MSFTQRTIEPPKSSAQLAAELVAECRKQGYLIAMREALALLDREKFGKREVRDALAESERAVYENRRSV